MANSLLTVGVVPFDLVTKMGTLQVTHSLVVGRGNHYYDALAGTDEGCIVGVLAGE